MLEAPVVAGAAGLSLEAGGGKGIRTAKGIANPRGVKKET